MQSESPHCLTHATFDRLPQELILEVYDCFKLLNPQDVDAALRIFLSICHSIRSTVIDCPVLWGDIRCRLAPPPKESKWLLLKLERVQDSPIRLFLHTEKVMGFAIDSPSLGPLLESCERWEELHVFIQNPIAQCLDFLAPIEGRLHRLRRLAISILPRCRASRGFWIPPFFKDAPVLNDISLPYMPAGALSSFSLRQLIRCEIFLQDHPNFKAKEEVTVLVANSLSPDSKLRTLKMTQRNNLNRDWDYGPLESPQLRSLELEDHRRFSPATSRDSPTNAWKDNAERFIECLTAPQIEEIIARCPYLQPSTLLRFTKRSGCSLKVLDLGQTFLDPVIMELLTTTSATLTHLRIQIRRLVDLYSFPEFKDPSFLPNLSSWTLSMEPTTRGSAPLKLSDMYDPPVDEEGVVDLLNSIATARCEGIPSSAPGNFSQSGLMHFQIEWDNTTHPRAYAQVLARLPPDSCGVDMAVVDTLKRYSEKLARLFESTRWAGTDGIINSLPDLFKKSVFQRVANAQYLYVSASLSSSVSVD